MPKTAPKPANSWASVLKTSSHKRRPWKRAKHWFCWIPRKRWAKMVSEVPKMIVLWNFETKSRLKASLAVWRNLLSYIFQGGLQPVQTSRPWSRPYCWKNCTTSDWCFQISINLQLPRHHSRPAVVCFSVFYRTTVKPHVDLCCRKDRGDFADVWKGSDRENEP